jgi:hypothetical protein
MSVRSPKIFSAPYANRFGIILVLCVVFVVCRRATAESLMLTIGLNQLDAAHYGTNVATLTGPDNDAMDATNFTVKWPSKQIACLLDQKATRTNVLYLIKLAGENVQSNELFVVFFSGHGGEIPDDHADAPNGMDQTWCLYDGQLLDRELYAQWSKFKKGVRIVVISDSCHSGGISKFTFMQLGKRDEIFTGSGKDAHVVDNIYIDPDSTNFDAEYDRYEDVFDLNAEILSRQSTEDEQHRRIKSLAPQEDWDVYKKNKDFYDGLVKSVAKPKFPIDAEVLSLSACGDNEFAADAGDFRNSVFTSALLSIWDDGKFNGSYVLFMKSVANLAATINPAQTATNRMIDQDDAAFKHQRPFTVSPPE